VDILMTNPNELRELVEQLIHQTSKQWASKHTADIYSALMLTIDAEATSMRRQWALKISLRADRGLQALDVLLAEIMMDETRAAMQLPGLIGGLAFEALGSWSDDDSCETKLRCLLPMDDKSARFQAMQEAMFARGQADGSIPADAVSMSQLPDSVDLVLGWWRKASAS